MKTIAIVLLVVAALILLVGLASRSVHVDLDYIAGVWHDVSLLALAAIAAALVLLAGMSSAVAAGLGTARDRRTLETELQRSYVRLRAAEGGRPGVLPGGPTPASPPTPSGPSRDDDEPPAHS